MTTEPRRPYHHGGLRDELVGQAIVLLAESGMSSFSVAQVAKRSGVSPGAPYRHFADRDALLAAAATEIARLLIGRLHAAVRAAPTAPPEQLAATAGAYTGFVLDHGVGLELIFAKQFQASGYEELHHQSRLLMDLLLRLVHSVSPAAQWEPSLTLLEAHLAVAEGFAAMQRRGAFAQRDLSFEQICERATNAARQLINGRHDPDGLSR